MAELLAEHPDHSDDPPMLALSATSLAHPQLDRYDRRKLHAVRMARAMARSPELRERGLALGNCAARLALAAELGPDGWGDTLLKGAWFCRQRLCPFCAWREAIAWRRRVTAGLDRMAAEHPSHRVIMLTLTQCNVAIPELSGELDRMARGWRHLVKRPEFKAAGWLRRTEITIGAPASAPDSPMAPRSYSGGQADQDQGDSPASVDSTHVKGCGLHAPPTAHPHIHALLVVRASYFGRDYVQQARWQELWADVMNLNYLPIVDVRAAYSKDKTGTEEDIRAAAVRECAKYVTKSEEILSLGPLLPEFASQIHRRRMIATSKWLSAYIKQGEVSADEMVDEFQSRIATGTWLHFVAEWSSLQGRYLPHP